MVNIFLEAGIDRKVFLPLLSEWFISEYRTIKPKRHAQAALLACPIWGDTFIDRFLTLCLPSLMAPGNIPAIEGGIVLMIHTDRDGANRLRPRLRFLTRYGVKTVFRIIPPKIMQRMTERVLNKFWLLGACQNFYFQYARAHGLGFHMLMPDHVYSSEFFYRLGKLTRKHVVIIQSSISGKLDPCAKEIDSYRRGNAIVIDAPALAGIAYRHLHPVMRSGLMNGRTFATDISRSHILLWQGKNEIRVYCPHASILWVSSDITQHLPLRLFSAVDTQLPHLFPEPVPFYIPQPRDNMAYVELSDDTKTTNAAPTHFDEFACRFWLAANYHDGYMRYFQEPHRFAVPDLDGDTPERIDASMSALITELIACKSKKYTITRATA